MTTALYPDDIPAATTRRIASMMRRAMDPAAMPGEAETSAVMAIRHARRERMTLAALADAIDPERRLPPPGPEPIEPPPACDVLLRFGRYRGRTLGEVASINIGYVEWLATEYDGYAIRDAAAAVLAYFTDGGRQ